MSRNHRRHRSQRASNRINYDVFQEQSRLRDAGFDLQPLPVDADLIPRIVREAFEAIENGKTSTRKGTTV